MNPEDSEPEKKVAASLDEGAGRSGSWMPFQYYISVPTALSDGETLTRLPFGPHDMAPDGCWESYVIACEAVTKDMQNRADAIVKRTQQYITSVNSLTVRRSPTDPIGLTSVDSESWDEISRFVQKNIGGFRLGE